MERSWRRLWFPALLAGAALLFHLTSGSPPRPPTNAGGRAIGANGETSAGAAPSVAPSVVPDGEAIGEAVPLLGGLRVGDVLDDWKVTRVVVNESVEKKPQLAVELERLGSGITIWVARKGNARKPALSTARYDFTFGHARPYGEPIPDDAYPRMMKLLADRVRVVETTAPAPAGL